MFKALEYPMYSQVDTKNPQAVESEVRTLVLEMFPDLDSSFVHAAFQWATQCFHGLYKNYQAIDARYHDYEHTLQGTLCMFRLLNGRHRSGDRPHLTPHDLELGLLGILFHDTGYLKKKGDKDGTGAKYTMTHVHRSLQFSETFLQEKGYPATDIATIHNLILCTGIGTKISEIQFQTEIERFLGIALGTADLLGQMAAPDYVDKLQILFEEFEESARYNAGRMAPAGTFSSFEDFLQKTPLFWKNYVYPKIEKDFQGVYRYLGLPTEDGVNDYLLAIEKNIARVQQQLEPAHVTPSENRSPAKGSNVT